MAMGPTETFLLAVPLTSHSILADNFFSALALFFFLIIVLVHTLLTYLSENEADTAYNMTSVSATCSFHFI